MYRNKFFKNKKSLCPISNRTKTVKSLFINHLLQHTIICLSHNGEIPSALSYKKCSALQLESDIPQKTTLTRLSPFPCSLEISFKGYCLCHSLCVFKDICSIGTYLIKY